MDYLKKIIYKPIGITPAELVEINLKKFNFKKGCFTGRLDPMAHGCMILLFDDLCKDVSKYHSLDKKYKFKMICGLSSSSNDLLGFIINIQDYISTNIMDISKILENFQNNEYLQKMPIHSSYQVSNGVGIKKPLWWWAKEDKISEIQIPSHIKKLYSFNILNKTLISGEIIKDVAIERIERISKKHNFNQDKIVEMWKKLGETHQFNSSLFEMYEIEVSVSSGFYIRALVEDIGKMLNIPTITFEIERLEYYENNN